MDADDDDNDAGGSETMMISKLMSELNIWSSGTYIKVQYRLAEQDFQNLILITAPSKPANYDITKI